ncbi:MAG: DUF3592 domain-containing protein [Candidatus Sumerlaeaceae bacterium]
MATYLVTRWGESLENPEDPQLRAAIAELDADDPEHPDCWLSDDAGWTLSAVQGGSVVLENVETGEGPWHLPHASHDDVLNLWRALRAGELEDILNRRWLGGEAMYPEPSQQEQPPDDFIVLERPADNTTPARLLIRTGSAIVIAAALVIMGQFASSLQWGVTYGILESAELSGVDMKGRVSSHGGTREVVWRNYHPEVEYTYRVSGNEYSGSSYAVGNVDAQEALTRQRVESLKSAYAAANQIKIHYRRSNPEISAIKLAFSLLSVTGVLLGAALAVFGVALRQTTKFRTAAVTAFALACTGATIVTIVLWLGGHAIEL